MSTTRKENITELAQQFGRTADRLRAKDAEQQQAAAAAAALRGGSGEIDANAGVDAANRKQRRRRKQHDDGGEAVAEASVNMERETALITDAGKCCSQQHCRRLQQQQRVHAACVRARDDHHVDAAAAASASNFRIPHPHLTSTAHTPCSVHSSHPFAVCTAQLENSGDEGEEGGGATKDYSGTGLRISGIEGSCRIPGSSRGLMTNIVMKECLESASMCVCVGGGGACVCVRAYPCSHDVQSLACLRMIQPLQVVQRGGQPSAAEGGRDAGHVHMELQGVELSQVIV